MNAPQKYIILKAFQIKKTFSQINSVILQNENHVFVLVKNGIQWKKIKKISILLN